MIRRPSRAVAASVCALALFTVSMLIAVCCLQQLLARHVWLPWTAWAEILTRTTASSPWVIAAAVVVGVVGLVLLAIALLPGRPTVIPLQPTTTELSAGVSQRSLARVLADTAREVNGVHSARSRVGLRSVRVHARTRLRQPAQLRTEIRAAIDARLDTLALDKPPRVQVGVHSKGSRP